MRILIIGERYSANLGDPIICESVEYLVKKNFTEAKISFLDLSARNKYVVTNSNKGLVREGKKSSLKKRVSNSLTKIGIDTEYFKFKKSFLGSADFYKEFFNTHKNSFDIAIFAGGQMFKDSFIFPILTVMDYLIEQRVPVIFNACGVGEIASPRMQGLLKEILSSENVLSITSRDDVDAINNLLKDVNKEAVKTYDPAVWVRDVYSIDKKQNEVVGLGIMYAHNIEYNQMLSFWTNMIHILEKENIQWKFFCNGTDKDYEFAKHILIKMGYDESQLIHFLEKQPTRPNELVEVISKFSAIISFRLHSHIVAYSLGIPGVAIVWDDKVRYFYETLDQDDSCFDITEDINTIVVKVKNKMKHEACKDLLLYQKNYTQKLLISSMMQVIGE